MNLKMLFVPFLCLLFVFKCNTDYSALSSIKSGFNTLSSWTGFDFSHGRIIDFRGKPMELTFEEKKM